MSTRGEETAQLLDALGGMVGAVLARCEELGIEVTAEQLATNVLPNLGRVAGDMLAHQREHGSLDGMKLTFVSADQQDEIDDNTDGM